MALTGDFESVMARGSEIPILSTFDDLLGSKAMAAEFDSIRDREIGASAGDELRG
ncbi:hypothetical protein ACT4ML_11990 [Natrinema sp. LN54]|uniref:hypothetical protein n=1 Tax=Natrinema sp. LN54 TaxID=3458705 RepID=UPI004035ADC9